MGHGRKKDQGSHRRHKSSASGAGGRKASDDPFSDPLAVVEEQLVWITWEELVAVLLILSVSLALLVYINYEFLSASWAFQAVLVPDRRVPTWSNTRTTIPEAQQPPSYHPEEDFFQLVDEPSTVECRTENPPLQNFDNYTPMRPHLCRDGKTYGYDTYQELATIVEQINDYSTQRYADWDSWYERSADTFDGTFQDHPDLYYDEEIVVNICPKAVLRKQRGPPIYINAENVLIECEDCILEIRSGSHMIFGPYAQDVMIRGIHFKGATETSIRFPYDGAEVYFEDCFFSDNGSRGKHIGTVSIKELLEFLVLAFAPDQVAYQILCLPQVADVNSTSSVDFMRCFMETEQEGLAMSSLSIRTKGEES